MIDIKEPNDLRVTLATMKSAKRQGVNMNIWDRDIEAVEQAIAMIEAMRQYYPSRVGERADG